MLRRDLLAMLHRWLVRMSDEQLGVLAADIKETMPEVCDPRLDVVVGRVREMLGGQEDAEGVVRVLRERGVLKVFLKPVEE